MAHMTGGGLTGNVPRMLPEGCGATIDLAAWPLPPVFDWLSRLGGLERSELLKTFNAGIGMVLAVPADVTDAAVNSLTEAGETVFTLGTVTDGDGVAYTGQLA